MTYRELVDRGADRTEIQTFLSGGGMHSTTIRIPDNLRMCLMDKLSNEGSVR